MKQIELVNTTAWDKCRDFNGCEISPSQMAEIVDYVNEFDVDKMHRDELMEVILQAFDLFL
jgi:hemerythrin-like domain-containing protein